MCTNHHLVAVIVAAAAAVWTASETAYGRQSCVTGFSPSVLTIPASGTPATVNVQTSSPGCQWAVTGSFPDWLNFPAPFSGVGPGTVSFNQVMPNNTAASRSATIAIGGVGLDVIQQANSCLLTLSPPIVTIPAAGGQGSFTVGVTAAPGASCSYDTRPGPGVAIVSGSSGNVFPATVTVSVGPNTTQEIANLFVEVSSTGTFGPTTPIMTIRQNGPPIVTDLPPLGIGFSVHSGAGGPHATAAEPVHITNAENSGAAWTSTTTEPWLVLTPASGTGPTLAAISINPAQAALLTRGSYAGLVRIASVDAPQSVRQVFVMLSITDAGSQTVPPFGVLDIPLQGATGLSGAVPVGGWAQDDVGIRRVQIFRDSVGGEPPGEVFVGDATRVRGARPDVAAFTRNPETTKAGWGLMVLSNVLPNQGNGTFTLSAYAEDIEGNRSLLGRKTVAFDNTNSVFPFGTIDNPTQGGSASGTANIQGWVLAQSGRTIPFDGSTIRLVVDGAILPNLASYGFPRPDVLALFPFPTYTNANGPAAQFALDTTPYTNGLHTVAWIATDDQGATQGLGSRYFTVSNLSSSVAADVAPARSAQEIRSLPQATAFVWDRTGFDDTGWSLRFAGGRTNMIRQAPAERLEVAFDAGWWSKGCGPYVGYLLRGDVAVPLPPGSSLDGEEGVFRWLPPAEFTGTFEFAFVRRTCSGREERIPLRVAIAPR